MSEFKVGDRVVVIDYHITTFIGKEGAIISIDEGLINPYAVDFGEELRNEDGFLLTHTCAGHLKNYTGYWIEGYCLELVDEDLIYSETIIRG